MRRSHEVRSLKIPHGLLQVSSRRREGCAACAADGRSTAGTKQSPVEPDFSLVPGRIGVFCDDRAQEFRAKCANRAFKATRTQMRQNCSSSQQCCLGHFELSGPSQIYNNVTGVLPVTGATRRTDAGSTRAPDRKRHESGRESRRFRFAKELSKGWRFFPTYACVQTGTVLRHPFLRRVTTNVGFDACRAAHR
ncbi:hypothetical protein SAMN05444171_5646 [Bradyrhizobium lablabi]|uniref:Uncharacterized protein n=2 Tax=Bradyrhizobium TaxID=374 RepID=A0ABY0PBE2_9BRAD|nr:hypothetical protein SAMN05444163_1524 [Bradyrhizobium ottawaense]SED91727.1 hypothetical protein SAMN05444171_5646 [Bradyrhizobium lablabi]SHL88109.1 hypothetical protein SAMN05444321_4441 [Bradyrhizobium lablabi]